MRTCRRQRPDRLLRGGNDPAMMSTCSANIVSRCCCCVVALASTLVMLPPPPCGLSSARLVLYPRLVFISSVLLLFTSCYYPPPPIEFQFSIVTIGAKQPAHLFPRALLFLPASSLPIQRGGLVAQSYAGQPCNLRYQTFTTNNDTGLLS